MPVLLRSIPDSHQAERMTRVHLGRQLRRLVEASTRQAGRRRTDHIAPDLRQDAVVVIR